MAKRRNSGRNSKPRRQREKIGRPERGTKDWAPRFLAAIVAGDHVRDACDKAKVDGTMPYKRRQDDPEFAKAWEEASDIGTRALEGEAARRAYHGTLKPKFEKGKVVGHIREYSDTLLMFLLRARRPRKYRDNLKVTGDVDVKHTFDDLTDAELDAEVRRLEKLRDGATGEGSPASA